MEEEPQYIDELTIEDAKKELDDLLLRVKGADLNDFGTYLVTKAVEARQSAKAAPARNCTDLSRSYSISSTYK